MPTLPWPAHCDVPMIEDTSMAALLAGAELPAGSAPEMHALAQALAGLREQPAGDELQGEAETLAAFRSQFGTLGTARRPSPARSRPSRRLRVRAAAAAAAAIGLGGIAATAYAGVLPAAAQRLAHDIIGAPAPGARQAIGPSRAQPTVAGHPAYGLCTAWAHARAQGTHKQQAAAFRRLAAAAGGAGNVTAYCATAAPPGKSPSHRPHPTPAPHGSGKPTAHPAPHGSGKPSGLPAPHGSGKPAGHPAPHGSGGPEEHPTGKPSKQS